MGSLIHIEDDGTLLIAKDVLGGLLIEFHDSGDPCLVNKGHHALHIGALLTLHLWLIELSECH